MATIQIKSTDDIDVFADYYQNENPDAPIILLCHQAGFSRGEYLETAPELVVRGYTCFAIDQRSGNTVNAVDNQTARQAYQKGLGLKYADAYPDIAASIEYITENFPNQKLMLVGSSYSSSLALILAVKYQDMLSCVACFSPGEYFTFAGKGIADWAKEINIPVFITSAKGEEGSWKNIFNLIPGNNKKEFIPAGEGIHGSRNLWNSTKNNVEYWEAFSAFLQHYFPVAKPNNG